MRKSLIKQVPPSHPLEKRDSQELGSSQPERVPCFLKMQVSLSLFCSSKLSASDSKEMRRIIFFDLFIYFRSYTTSPWFNIILFRIIRNESSISSDFPTWRDRCTAGKTSSWNVTQEAPARVSCPPVNTPYFLTFLLLPTFWWVTWQQGHKSRVAMATPPPSEKGVLFRMWALQTHTHRERERHTKEALFDRRRRKRGRKSGWSFLSIHPNGVAFTQSGGG